MIKTTEKINQRRIVLISLLKSKGINDKRIFSQVLYGKKSTLNLIYAKHIKASRINDRLFLKHIIKDRYFRKFLLVDKIDVISMEIDKILNYRYANNKSNTLFQEFIQFLLEYLLTFNNTHLSFDVYMYIKDNYKVNREVNIIDATRKAGKYTLEKLKLVGELIDHIDYLNFLNNDITKIQRLRMKSVQNYNIDRYIINFFNSIEAFVKTDKDLMEIYKQLTLNTGRIETKLLYNKLVKLKQDLRETLYVINYGTNYSDKASSKDANSLTDVMKSAILPFHESGKLELSDKQFHSLNINTIFCSKLNDKFIKNLKNGKYNKRKIDGSIKIIAEGENRYNKGKFSRTYFIHYQYVITNKQIRSFKRIKHNLRKSCINDRKYKNFDSFKDYVKCVYTYPYFNQKTNYEAFKEYFKENVQTNLSVHYSYVYPYANKINAKKYKYLSFTSWNNNIWRDYLLRQKIDRNLANIIYNLNLNREITNMYNPKNQNKFTKRKQKLFLKDLLVEIKADHLSKFSSFLSNLSKDYSNRMYLFKTYGINALANQIQRLQQFYDSKFENKRTTQAKHTKQVITTLKLLLPLRREYLDMLKMQKLTIDNNLINLNPYNVLIQSILHDNIEKYLTKTIIRKIEQPRSIKGLILMACNNIKPLSIDYMDTMPVYIKEINTEYTKLDELLNDKDGYKVEYIDKKSKIDIVALFKAIIKFDRYLELDDLYRDILDFDITTDKKLMDYVYKEKDILNT